MPLYVFKCDSCGREFEELCKGNVEEVSSNCPECGNQAGRKVAATFGISTKLNPKTETIYSRKEIDRVVGDAANQAWEGYDSRWRKYYRQRQESRRSGKEPREITIKPGSDGKVSPFEHLGSKKEQEFRREYGKEYHKQVTSTGKKPDTPVVMKKIL